MNVFSALRLPAVSVPSICSQ